MECRRRRLLGFTNRLGVVFIFLAGLLIFSGCVTTEAGPMAMAREIHSMTPCGMMMGAMMGDGHGDHNGDEIHHEAQMNMQTPNSE